VEANKSAEHDGDYEAKHEHDHEHFIFPLKVANQNPPVGSELLASAIYESFVPQFSLVHQVTQSEKASNAPVEANTQMHKKEKNEVLVVMKADTVVDPDAVMVKFFAAHVAQRAMLAASRLWDLASITPTFLIKHYVVVVVAFDGTLSNYFIAIFAQETGISPASQVIRIVAGSHEGPRDVLVVASEISVRDVLKSIHHIQVITADRQHKIHYLDCWVRLVTNVRLRAFDEPDEFLASW